jgi:hypothetical protein
MSQIPPYPEQTPAEPSTQPTNPQEASQKRVAFWRRLIGRPPNVYSRFFQECFEASKNLAREMGSRFCTPLHLLHAQHALQLSPSGIGPQILRVLNFHGEEAAVKTRAHLVMEWGSAPSGKGELSDSFKILIALAGRQAQRQKDYYVGTTMHCLP